MSAVDDILAAVQANSAYAASVSKLTDEERAGVEKAVAELAAVLGQAVDSCASVAVDEVSAAALKEKLAGLAAKL